MACEGQQHGSQHGVPEIIGQNTLAQQRVLTDLLMRQGTSAEPG